MAYGLPVEGEDGPFAGDVAAPVPAVGADEAAAEVLERLRGENADRAVVTVADGVVLGLVERQALEDAEPGAPAAAVMALMPSTVRPSAEYGTLQDQGDEHTLVTTPDGRLVGIVEPEASGEPDGGRDVEGDMLETIAAVEEHFGGAEVSEDDIRSFLRQRLVDEGRTAEEADRLLASLGDEQPG